MRREPTALSHGPVILARRRTPGITPSVDEGPMAYGLFVTNSTTRSGSFPAANGNMIVVPASSCVN